MVDVTLIRPLNKAKLAVVACVLHRRDSWSFLERGQNMATEASPLGPCIWNSLPAELQTGSEIFNGECDAMIK